MSWQEFWACQDFSVVIGRRGPCLDANNTERFTRVPREREQCTQFRNVSKFEIPSCFSFENRFQGNRPLSEDLLECSLRPQLRQRPGIGGRLPRLNLHIWQVAKNAKPVPLKLCSVLLFFSYCAKPPRCPHTGDNAIMRISALSFGLLALLTPLTAAWTKEGK